MKNNLQVNVPQFVCSLIAVAAIALLPFFKFSLIVTFYRASALQAGFSYSPIFLLLVALSGMMVLFCFGFTARHRLICGLVTFVSLLVIAALLRSLLTATDLALLVNQLGGLATAAGIDIRANDVMTALMMFLHLDIGFWCGVFACGAYCVFSVIGKEQERHQNTQNRAYQDEESSF